MAKMADWQFRKYTHLELGTISSPIWDGFQKLSFQLSNLERCFYLKKEFYRSRYHYRMKCCLNYLTGIHHLKKFFNKLLWNNFNFQDIIILNERPIFTVIRENIIIWQIRGHLCLQKLYNENIKLYFMSRDVKHNVC